MNVWEWVEEYERKARDDGDDQRLRMTQIHPVAYRFRETDPDRALAMFEEGRRLAQALNEPWWVLFFDHWKSTALLHFKRDFRTVLDHTVRQTLEVRKPLYQGHPLRLAVFDDLVAAYLGIDPEGHAEPILQALEYLEHEVPAGPDSNRYLLLARQRRFEMERKDLDAAHAVTQTELALADQDTDRYRSRHFSVFVYDGRCEIAYRRNDWEALEIEALAGEDLARVVGHQLELSELLVWQALARRHQGDKPNAQRLFRTASMRFDRLKMPPNPSGFDSLAAFHEMDEDWPRVLAVRNQELKVLSGKGRWVYEARCRLHRLRLMALVGKPPPEEVAATREVIARLKKPEPYLAQLAKYET